MPDNPEGNPAATSRVTQLTRHLRAALAEGRLVPGQRVTEAELTERFGIGRGAAREALRELAADGLIDLSHNRGARIRRLDRRDVAALYDIREVAEGLAARRAAEALAQGAPQAALTHAFDALERALAELDATAFLEANASFHGAIVAASGNPHLEPLLQRLALPILRLQFRTAMTRAAMEQSQGEHRILMTALRAGDGALAEARMRAHVARARSLIAGLPDSAFA